MSGAAVIKLAGRARRKKRVRKKVKGDSTRPRLSVFRSNRHMYCQIVDDEQEVTLASAATIEKGFPRRPDMSKTDMAKAVGEIIAERAKANGIDRVVFDRSGYKFHGRVKALAEGAREKGLSF